MGLQEDQGHERDPSSGGLPCVHSQVTSLHLEMLLDLEMAKVLMAQL